jgi:hypothetical protein
MQSSFLNISNNKIPTLLAMSDAEQQLGLMYRTELPPSMSFVYPFPKINKFWMKSTPCALDIVFCCGGKIIDICKGEPMSTRTVGPDSPSDLVVEFPYGTCQEKGIKIGDAVDLPEMQTIALFSKKYY